VRGRRRGGDVLVEERLLEQDTDLPAQNLDLGTQGGCAFLGSGGVPVGVADEPGRGRELRVGVGKAAASSLARAASAAACSSTSR
jgi:hypothetical protein